MKILFQLLCYDLNCFLPHFRDSYKEATQEVLATEAGYNRDFELGIEEEEANLPNDLFLFKMLVPNNNILSISEQTAVEYFIVPLNISLVTSAKAENWEIPLAYNPEQAFTNTIK